MLDQCHNIEQKIPGPDPLRAQRAGDDGARPAPRPRGPGRGAVGERRARGERRIHGCLLHGCASRPGRPGARAAGFPPTRWPPTRHPDTRSATPQSASAACRPAGVPKPSSPVASARCDDLLPTTYDGRNPKDSHDEPCRRRPHRAEQPPRVRPEVTNYAGGNTSAKGTEIDPVTGAPVELMWVKGSGGDLGTLTEKGLAVLRVDRLRALQNVYPGLEREDEMVAAFDHTCSARGGPHPRSTPAMHGLVDAAHVDHLHPDAGIAIAHRRRRRGADREDLRRQGRVGTLAAPGLPAGLDIAAIRRRIRRRSARSSAGTASRPGATRRKRRSATACGSIDTAQAYIDAHGAAEPPALSSPATSPCRSRSGMPARRRSPRRSGESPPATSAWSVTTPTSDVVLDFLSREKLAHLAALGTSCPDHFLRTKVRPLVLGPPRDGEPRAAARPSRGAARGVPG